MFSKVLSAHVLGINATGIEAEADLGTAGLPSFTIVGLAEGAVKESKERVRSALRNIDFNIFARPITINLAPADIKKDGSHFDLPIAVGLITALEPAAYNIADTVFLGELSLDGALRGVSGVLCMCSWARDNGIKRVIVPMDNAAEAALVPGIDVYPFEHISGVIGFIRGELEAKPFQYTPDNIPSAALYAGDFAEIKGQYYLRRAAEIAAAGMHNILMMGSPGSGKTMIARRMVSILPPMSIEEALLTTKVHSVAGLLSVKGDLIKERPFVAPHHTASNVAIVGGGAKAMPGHVSIATNGILFLDEMLEFNRTVLEVLRQPMEDGTVTIARAGRTVCYPANFMLVAACNPCPCGYYGDNKKTCTCAPGAVERYRARLSGPLLDRIDMHVNVASVDYKDLENTKPGESSASIRERVIAAHNIQKARFTGKGVSFNSQMPEAMLRQEIHPSPDATRLLSGVMERMRLSARGYSKVLKVSRTIADLAAEEQVTAQHIAEALQYRGLTNE